MHFGAIFGWNPRTTLLCIFFKEVHPLIFIHKVVRKIHAIPFYKKRSYKKRPIDFRFVRNEDPLNFSTIRNEKIKKALFFQKLRNNFLLEENRLKMCF